MQATIASPSADWHIANARRRSIVTLFGSLALGLLLAFLVLRFEVLTVVGLLTWLATIAIAWRPFVGLCIAFGLCMVFEPGGADQLMLPGVYIHGGLGSTVGLNGA